MGIFNNKKTNRLASIMQATPVEPAVNHQSVLDYLISLEKTDFDKLFKVANVYRTADKEAARILGVKPNQDLTLDDNLETQENILTDVDEELDAAFLEAASNKKKK